MLDVGDLSESVSSRCAPSVLREHAEQPVLRPLKMMPGTVLEAADLGTGRVGVHVDIGEP